MWASRLLEQELRAYEARIAEKYVVESLTPTSDDDTAVVAIVMLDLQTSVDSIREKIGAFSKYEGSGLGEFLVKPAEDDATPTLGTFCGPFPSTES